MRGPEKWPTHVFDLPQLYTKPTAPQLFTALDLLALPPRTFAKDLANEQHQLQTADVCRYLTSIIGSSLAWIDCDITRDNIRDVASARLCERAGRNAMPSMSREFKIPLNNDIDFSVTLHEPSLTADDLGKKTWVSSFMLSKRLHTFHSSRLVPTTGNQNLPLRTLELGAGTGLVGISFAAIWGAATTVCLTDLPSIIPNLSHNVGLNGDLILEAGSNITTDVLDWSLQFDVSPKIADKYDIILTADPLYSPDHPRWLAQTIEAHISTNSQSRLVVELPLREAYLPQINELKKRLRATGLSIIHEGEEIGYDDWATKDGSAVEVRCWWSVWGWENPP